MSLQRQSSTCPHRQELFKIDKKTRTVGGTVEIRLHGGASFEGLVVGAPKCASILAGLSVASEIRAGDFLQPFPVDDVVVGRIVSSHWLTQQTAAFTRYSVDKRKHKVTDLEPITDFVGVVEQPAFRSRDCAAAVLFGW